MAAEDLPSEFDVVILGTGLCESVVAAACSRVGQRVLHLDRQSYYASNWASFTFNGLLTWIQEQQAESQPDEVQDWSGHVEEGEELIYLSQSDSSSISNLQVFCYTSEEDEEDETPNTTEEEKGGGDSEATEAADSNKEDEEQTEKKEAEEQAAQDEGVEPEADQPCPSADANQSEPVKKKKISLAQLVKEGRRFNIDLVSKLMYSRGSLVDLLIKSNVSRYAEFKNVSRILTYRQGKVEQVPCSRADVFASRQLSVVEKRKLMRFLTSCVEETEDQQAHNGRPYLEFLSDHQLGENLQHFLLYSIAMATEDTPTEVGLASTRHFLRCLGRYGNTPFLFPVYGLGEIPQCFCRCVLVPLGSVLFSRDRSASRHGDGTVSFQQHMNIKEMCAVFGGIYCLRHSVKCLLVDKDTQRCKAVIDSRGQRISCNHFVVEEGYVDTERKRTAMPTRCVSRAVLITDGSVLPSDSDQQVSMVTIPPVEAELPSVRMVELCSSTMTCMPGTYLVHLTCQSVGSAYEDLSPLVTRMFHTTESPDQEERPSVLWCLYFNMVDGSGLEVEGHDLPSNIYLCSGPDGALGHDHTIKQAELIFQKILPEEDFCPPAPNPEDIIYDGENGNGNSAEGEELKDDELKDNEEPKEQEEELKEQEEKKEEEQEVESDEGRGLETEE